MPSERSMLLAHHQEFGSVHRCSHGCFHVQEGTATIALNEGQYRCLVVMLNDSAVNYESLLSQFEPEASNGLEPGG